jgi:DNA polymerase-3 subunit delta
MLIFVYGDDTFRVQEKVVELKSAFLKKFDPTGINVSTFPAEAGGKIEVGDVLQAVCSLPFLTPRRMVIVRGLVGSLKKDETEIWSEGFKRIPDSTIVVLWETEDPKVLEKKPLFKEWSKGSDVHAYSFPVLEGAELSKWTASRIKARGGTIASDALAELVGRVGGDLWQMDGEIQKLVSYCAGKPIMIDTVRDMVRPTFAGEIFALMDAVSQKRPELALRLLEQERAAGSDDFYLFVMLTRQVRILLGARSLLDADPRVSQAEAAQELGVHPFVAQKALAQARSFSTDDLRAAHELLFQYDLATKSGGMDADLAVDLIATKLLS